MYDRCLPLGFSRHGLIQLTTRRAYLGSHSTNNSAEYDAAKVALRTGLRYVKRGGTLRLFSDNENVIKQLRGERRITKEDLRAKRKSIPSRVRRLADRTVSWHFIKREHNSTADRLANEALDEQ